MKNRFPLFLIATAAAVAASAQQPAPADLPAALDLKTAIGYALDHNFPIRQAREQIRLQEGLILQARAPEIPNLSAAGEYQRNQSAISQYYPPALSVWTVAVKATQTVYAGGGIDASVKGAKLGRDAALYDLQGAINAALLDVRTKFYGVLLAREKVRVQEQNVALFERQLSDTRNQFKAGSVSNFEVLRAEVSLANAQPDLITARNDYRVAIEQLRQSLGASSGRPGSAASFPEVEGTLDYSPESYDLDSALAGARENRPELLSLAKRRDAGEQTVRTAASGYLPNVSVFGSYEWLGANFASDGHYDASGWLFGAQSSWNIFDGRATAGRVRQARSQLEQARLAYDSQELAIEVEVRQALSSLQEAAELVAATGKTVDQAEEALRLANERYRVGSATQLDVLTSQVALTQARTNQLQSNYTYLVALAAMRKAIGLGDALVGH